ncbi:hypothetical protein L6452_01783 [Arctium lappa]|uniref:Uncharacterized protein n=1 Tax=Arctium lappa TaxID=4217 RepID=A0ACB9FHL4_ARCLA|nr:hypothetical protein L6452_01783 [Arctium lappa]
MEESMHRKTRKSRIPNHRINFSDPNTNFRNMFMEKANVWLMKKRQASLQRKRAIMVSRQSVLNDEDVAKISQMPSLPATDAVPFNKGRYEENKGGYEENKGEEEGSIPLPSITSKSGPKPCLDGEGVKITGILIGKTLNSPCVEYVSKSEHGSASVNFLKSNNISVEDGQVLESAASFGMNMDEHHIQTNGNLQDQKDPPKILYFGNKECRLNMAASYDFFEKFNEGHYEEVFSEGEER